MPMPLPLGEKGQGNGGRKMVPGTCEKVGFTDFWRGVFSMIYGVNNTPKVDFFTGS
jgi:hypothetical protein